MEDFPNNSHVVRKQEQVETPKEGEVKEPTPITKKIVEGKVTERQKTLGVRFKDMFVAEGTNFSGQLYKNIVKPKVQDLALTILGTVLDGIKEGVEEVITGKPARRGGDRASGVFSGRRHTPYDRVRPAVPVRDSQRFSDGVVPIRRSNRVQELIVSSREEGEAVLEALEAQIEGPIRHCTVGDYYELLGRSVVSTDHEWGWTDLSGARVRILSDNEYLIVMPTPRPIAS
jgi:hypothetical protein